MRLRLRESKTLTDQVRTETVAAMASGDSDRSQQTKRPQGLNTARAHNAIRAYSNKKGFEHALVDIAGRQSRRHQEREDFRQIRCASGFLRLDAR